ncbi:MAG: ABC transporter ATP-binding protein [Chitinophagaceae bacterium]
MAIAIQTIGLSKAYQLGEFSTGTLSRDIERLWYKVRGKEDPFLKIGETNDRTVKGTSDIVWSLNDLNFEIEQGEAVGIIGRNGAGKSTLLKVLSRVTTPTKGVVKIKGRIASLLEVGTGFHPELTGRENIFLNGAILGMRKQEIKKRFDEIVAFAGVERYIDTPVKRYSSGMYVRLAFAVAAHLESEILIVDEVLAVGDAEFQNKCLGKMGEVSKNGGKTVLFVSHNMASIKKLCSTGIYLKHGQIEQSGKIDDVINGYFLADSMRDDSVSEANLANEATAFTKWQLVDGINETAMYSGQQCVVQFDFICNKAIRQVELGLVLRDNRGELIYSCNSRDGNGDYFDLEPGKYEFTFQFRFPVKHGYYEIDVAAVSNGAVLTQWVSAKKLQVISKLDSPLGDQWLGILSEPLAFSYSKELH